MTLDTHELAWAAGFFDGEGNFNFAPYKKPTNWWKENRQLGQTRLRVCQADTHALERFQQALGGIGKIYGPYKNAGQNRFQIWEFSITSFEKMQAAVAMLWPWLGPIKREQAKQVLLKARGLA